MLNICNFARATTFRPHYDYALSMGSRLACRLNLTNRAPFADLKWGKIVPNHQTNRTKWSFNKIFFFDRRTNRNWHNIYKFAKPCTETEFVHYIWHTVRIRTQAHSYTHFGVPFQFEFIANWKWNRSAAHTGKRIANRKIRKTTFVFVLSFCY